MNSPFTKKFPFTPRAILVSLIRGYQKYLSPLFPPTCRYVPTCSEYAIIAIRRFGCLRGGWMATWRVLRCNPWHRCGYDPVPEKADANTDIDADTEADGAGRLHAIRSKG